MKNLFLSLLLVLFALPAMAEEVPKDMDEQYGFFTEAIGAAAQIDAYNAFCEQESDFRSDFIRRAEKEHIVGPEDPVFQDLQSSAYDGMMEALKERNPPCKGIEFLMGKLGLMKELKALAKNINAANEAEVVETPAPDPL